MNWWLVLAAGVVGACATPGGPAPSVTPAPDRCEPVDSLRGAWRATVFIDGRRVGDHLRARREPVEPETFELTDAEPPTLAALRPEAVDLLQFSRGKEAENTFGLCSGYVAFLVTTK